MSSSAITRSGGCSLNGCRVFSPARTIRRCQCRVTPNIVCGQGVDLVGQLLLTDAGADHRAALDLVEQLRRLILGVEKPFRPQVFVEDRLLHSNDATT